MSTHPKYTFRALLRWPAKPLAWLKSWISHRYKIKPYQSLIVTSVVVIHVVLLVYFSIEKTLQEKPTRTNKLVVTTVKLQPQQKGAASARIQQPLAEASQAASKTEETPAPTKKEQPKPPQITKEAIAPDAFPKAATPKKTVAKPAASKAKPTAAKAKEKPKAATATATPKKKKEEPLAATQPPKESAPNKEALKKVQNDAKEQKVLSQLQKTLSEVNLKANPSVSQELAPAPKSLGSLHVDAFSTDQIGGLTFEESTYVDELINHLRIQLQLPEYGEVKISLTIERSGKIASLSIVSTKSNLNRHYIENTLSSKTMPAFGKYFSSQPKKTFIIALRND